jgi:hypothetical protein
MSTPLSFAHDFLETARALARRTYRCLGVVLSSLVGRGSDRGVPTFDVSRQARSFGTDAVREALDDVE